MNAVRKKQGKAWLGLDLQKTFLGPCFGVLALETQWLLYLQLPGSYPGCTNGTYSLRWGGFLAEKHNKEN